MAAAVFAGRRAADSVHQQHHHNQPQTSPHDGSPTGNVRKMVTDLPSPAKEPSAPQETLQLPAHNAFLTGSERFNKSASGTIVVAYWRSQEWCHQLYTHTTTELLVACLIVSNFLVNAAEAQVPGKGVAIFTILELLFTVVFCIELVVNMMANQGAFWNTTWNWFDFFVVVISLVSLVIPNVPGVGILRLIRAFRVVRLFKRAKSLRKLLTAINDSIPGVANAFSILMLVMMLYAILAVDFLGEDHPYYFETFSKALFTMFQMMTAEGWADIAREVMDKSGDWYAIFFITFILICNIMLANVVIAVLIEQVCADKDDEDEEAEYMYPHADEKLLPSLESAISDIVSSDGTVRCPVEEENTSNHAVPSSMIPDFSTHASTLSGDLKKNSTENNVQAVLAAAELKRKQTAKKGKKLDKEEKEDKEGIEKLLKLLVGEVASMRGELQNVVEGLAENKERIAALESCCMGWSARNRWKGSLYPLPPSSFQDVVPSSLAPPE